MNSFKKIALAMVAAMTIGTIVATPANAAVMTVADHRLPIERKAEA